MPRAIWTGGVAFGLVNVPVRMYAAIDEQDLSFHLVHRKDGSRIRYEKVCKAEDKPVPNDEIVKGYDLGDGELVLLEPEDFEAAETETGKTIEIVAFVPEGEIDPISYERSYYVGPQEGAEKVYRLLVEAMERSGLVGVVRFVFHDRDHLGALRVRDGVLVLASMYFADEIRPSDDIRPSGKSKIDDRELGLALDLVGRFEGEFDYESFEDRYRARLLAVIERKRKGGAVAAPAPEKPAAPPDLLTALRESIERTKGARSRSNGGNGDGRLEDQSLRELSERARELDIEGRSKMTKKELVRAIRSAQK
jgi:DNA end-binding protein Ku